MELLYFKRQKDEDEQFGNLHLGKGDDSAEKINLDELEPHGHFIETPGNLKCSLIYAQHNSPLQHSRFLNPVKIQYNSRDLPLPLRCEVPTNLKQTFLSTGDIFAVLREFHRNLGSFTSQKHKQSQS